MDAAAAHGFGRAADAYERGRPGYPAPAVRWLVRTAGIGPDATVLDLAAGTGKLTRLLVATGATVVAVEPVAAMRAALVRTTPGAAAVDGTAEAIPLPDAAVDVVTVAQAFHWFDGPRAVAEIHRVLRPGGRLALVWNTRDQRDPLQSALTAVLEPLRGDVPAHRGGRWRAALAAADRFAPRAERQVAWVHEVDADRLVDLVLSISFVATLPAGPRADVERRVRRLADEQPTCIPLRYVTELACYRRR